MTTQKTSITAVLAAIAVALTPGMADAAKKKTAKPLTKAQITKLIRAELKKTKGPAGPTGPAGPATPSAVADGSITAAKLADGSVLTGKIGDNTVTLAKLADNSVGSAEIVDGSVAAGDLNADAIPLRYHIKDAATTVSSVGATPDGAVGTTITTAANVPAGTYLITGTATLNQVRLGAGQSRVDCKLIASTGEFDERDLATSQAGGYAADQSLSFTLSTTYAAVGDVALKCQKDDAGNVVDVEDVKLSLVRVTSRTATNG